MVEQVHTGRCSVAQYLCLFDSNRQQTMDGRWLRSFGLEGQLNHFFTRQPSLLPNYAFSGSDSTRGLNLDQSLETDEGATE